MIDCTRKELEISIHSVQHTGASLKLQFEEGIESEITQNVADTQQHLIPPLYDDEDVIDWDVAITSPPSRPSGTIRVKLKYKGRSKPFPIENFQEE